MIISLEALAAAPELDRPRGRARRPAFHQSCGVADRRPRRPRRARRSSPAPSTRKPTRPEITSKRSQTCCRARARRPRPRRARRRGRRSRDCGSSPSSLPTRMTHALAGHRIGVARRPSWTRAQANPDATSRSSGRRPSSASFSRCARSVSAAAGRSCAGTSDQARSSSSSSVRAPARSASHQQPLALEAVGDVLVELGGGIPDVGPVAGAEHVEVELAQPAQGVEVGRQRALAGRDEHRALAEHRVAGEADPAEQQADVVGRVAGRGDRAERAHLLALGRKHHRHIAGARRERLGALGVVGVRMGEHDALDAAAGRGEHGVEVRLVVRARDRPPSRRRRRCWCRRA